jgi:hypothetical protein
MNSRTLDTTAPANEKILADEFRRLSHYLTGAKASDYQISKYIRFHQLNAFGAARRFDRWLDAAAAWGGTSLALVDAYSGTFCRGCPIQRKLMVAIAILECSPPSFRIFDTPRGAGRWVYLRLATASVSCLAVLAASVMLFAPAHLCARIADRVSR